MLTFTIMSLEQLDLFGNPIPAAPLKKEKQKAVQQPLFGTVDELEIEVTKPPVFIESEAIMLTIDLHTTAEAIDEKEPVTTTEDVADITELFILKEVIPEQKTTEPFVYSDDNIRVKVKEKLQEIALVEQTPIATKRPEAAYVSHLQKRGRKSHKDLEASVDLINIPDEETLKLKLYYSISEVAGWFNVNVSQIRFWENEFDILQPRKTKKGDRLFRVEDIKNLELIYHLIRQRKFSIEGAKAYLKSNKQKVDINFELVQSLTKFRSFLLELKANLG